MHADDTCDLNALEHDLQSEQVMIRFRKDGGERVVTAGRTPCGKPHVEVVMVPTLVVWKHCGCSQCGDYTAASKEAPTCIPVRDVVDVEVKDWEPGYPPDDRPEPTVLARWLRSRFWKLKRLALDD